MMKRVGIIGIGKMGHPMARHVLARGFEVFAYDVDQSRSPQRSSSERPDALIHAKRLHRASSS